jgi:hypothetical protein
MRPLINFEHEYARKIAYKSTATKKSYGQVLRYYDSWRETKKEHTHNGELLADYIDEKRNQTQGLSDG